MGQDTRSVHPVHRIPRPYANNDIMLRAAIVRQTVFQRKILRVHTVCLVKANVLRNRQAVSPKLVRHHGNIAVVAVSLRAHQNFVVANAAAL